MKNEYPNESRQLRALLAASRLHKKPLSCSARGHLAIAEADKVCIMDAAQLVGRPAAASAFAASPASAASSSSTSATAAAAGATSGNSSNSVRPLSRSQARFEVVSLEFHPANESYLAVAGLREVLILALNSKGEVVDRLAVESGLGSGADDFVLGMQWISNSDSHLLLASPGCVKTYDLAVDSLCPQHCVLAPPGEAIVAVAAAPVPAGALGLGAGPAVCLLALMQSGALYIECVPLNPAESPARVVADGLEPAAAHEASLYFSRLLPVPMGPVPAAGSEGSDVAFIDSLGVVVASYSDGSALVGRLDSRFTAFAEVAPLMEAVGPNSTGSSAAGGGPRPVAGLSFWQPLVRRPFPPQLPEPPASPLDRMFACFRYALPPCLTLLQKEWRFLGTSH